MSSLRGQVGYGGSGGQRKRGSAEGDGELSVREITKRVKEGFCFGGYREEESERNPNEDMDV